MDFIALSLGIVAMGLLASAALVTWPNRIIPITSKAVPADPRARTNFGVLLLLYGAILLVLSQII